MKLNTPSLFEKLPSAVIFDTDNTLYPYDPAHEAAHAAVEEKFRKTLNVTAAQFENSFRLAREETKQRLKGMASSHSRLLYFQRTLEILGLGSQVLLALEFEQTYWRTFLAHAHLFDGVKDVLETLRMLRIPCAIVTDLTAQIQFRKVVYFGLDNLFDFIVSSEEACWDKPNPAPFILALEKLGLHKQPFPLNSVWMVGDNPLNDIAGSKSAFGATTLQKLHDGVKKATPAADLEFKDFRELDKILRSLAQKEGKIQ